MATSQWGDFVGILSGNSQFPVGLKFVPVKFNPRLHQSQLLTGQFSRQNLTIFNADRCFKLSITGGAALSRRLRAAT
ncbi:MAG: hypothetical protein A2X83_07485 [Desulfuromonadales bacterium GWD2_54_10]|nr:MAG: hypothetical protein A2X83_07485 [Desulfuromonadales bacterium GWD2_54_10]